MNALIVHYNGIVTLLGAAAVTQSVFSESTQRSEFLIAADGGAAHAITQGIIPDAVIGDFDSLEPALRAQIPAERLHQAVDQNRTDFDKALSAVSARLVLAVGFTGGRLDHELAVYNALVCHLGSPAIVIGNVDVCFHARSLVNLTLPVGTRVSLFPLAEMTIESNGLKWPTDGIEFGPMGRVGTSNETAAQQVSIRPSQSGLLIIVPRSALDAVITALAG